MTTTKQKTIAEPAKKPMDRLLFLLTLMLLCVGIVTVYDASYALALENRHGDSFYFVKLQAIWAGIGLIALLITLRVPYWRWRAWAVVGVSVAALLLVAVFVPHVGINVGGGRRWIGHGPIRIQPSELTKLALVVYLARVTAVGPKTMRQFRLGIMPPLIVIAALAALIAKEPDLGTTIVLVSTALTMLFLAGARPKHLALVVAAAAAAVTLYAVTSSYRLHRLIAFTNPKADAYHYGYQVWHALIALGSGGITGLGLGEGREKLYIPMARTDFIFPVIAEEWGLIGTLILVTVFLLVAARGFAIAYRTRDPFGALLAAGLTTLISLQALVNMAVATGSIPNTGVPLPFISYGGSSLVLMMAGIGLLLNISCYPEGPGVLEGAQGRLEPNEADWERRWERRPYLPRAGDRPRPPATTVKRLDRARRPNSGVYWR